MIAALRGLLVLGLLLCSGGAQAWSVFGHEHIAELAERQLEPRTRAAALALLEGEADSLAAVAGWADQMRDEAGYEWATPLHFVNFPRGRCEYVASRDCPGGACVVGAVERFAAELGDQALPRARRVEALKFLVHYVGDLHQPLHCGFGHDKGGNTFQVNIDGQGSNLHRVWDYFLPARLGADATSQLAALLAEPLPAPGPLQPARWAEESCLIVQTEGFYPARRRLGEAYLQHHLPTARAQMRLAAARLAAILEAGLGAAR